MTRTIISTSAAALAALALAACGSDSGSDSSAAADLAPVADSSPAAPENGDSDLSPPPGPQIDVPPVDPCPYHEEVGQEDGHSAQINRALDLGCEMDIHGEIQFTQPIMEDEHGNVTDALIDPARAMSEQQMCDEGYIDTPYCESIGAD